MRKLLYLIVIVLVGLVGAGWYVLQDPNRFKPELETLISEQTGLDFAINGKLGWRLWPPVLLTANDLVARDEETLYTLASLNLDLDALSLLKDLESFSSWRIQALTLENLRQVEKKDDGEEVLLVERLNLQDLVPDKPAAFSADVVLDADTAEALSITTTGLVTYLADSGRVHLNEMAFDSTLATGQCDITVVPVNSPTPGPEETDDDLIPVDTFRSLNWAGECNVARAELDGEVFNNISMALDNNNGVSNTTLTLPEFFTGDALATVAIDASQTPVKWRIEPTLNNVDSQQLITWLDKRLQWVAPIIFGGTLEMTGNTEAELLASLSGEATFDGGTGQLGIQQIKQQLLTLAALFGKTEKVGNWPDMLDYQQFTGDWVIDQQKHRLDFRLDNLAVIATGDYAPADDAMDFLAELTFLKNAEVKSLEVNPLLEDLAIPMRCTGGLNEPKCRIDSKAAQRLVTSVLVGDEKTALRERIEEKIDEKVPEEYREAARGILDLLGGALEDTEEPETKENE